jgi:hypothetical protein
MKTALRVSWPTIPFLQLLELVEIHLSNRSLVRASRWLRESLGNLSERGQSQLVARALLKQMKFSRSSRCQPLQNS